MSDDFNENYEEFSKEEDMVFCKDMLISQAGELQDVYRYIYDFHRQHPCDELAVVLRYVELNLHVQGLRMHMMFQMTNCLTPVKGKIILGFQLKIKEKI